MWATLSLGCMSNYTAVEWGVVVCIAGCVFAVVEELQGLCVCVCVCLCSCSNGVSHVISLFPRIEAVS